MTASARRGSGTAPARHRSAPLRLLGAVLCAFVVAMHVIDQGGPTGLKDPAYVGYLYYALEVAGALVVLLLLTRRTALPGWVVALGVAVGPLVGYLVTRSIGLPNYTDDVGNWTEPLGLASLAVEGPLLICTLAALVAPLRARRSSVAPAGVRPVPDHGEQARAA